MSKTLPIAVQVYSVREEAERDFAGTMKKLGEMGYDGVELAGLYGKSAEEIRDSIKAAGLTAISAHVSYDELAGDLEKTLQDYETIGCRYIVIPWLGEDRRFGAALYEETIKGIPVISEAVSYTHLDVYKRQIMRSTRSPFFRRRKRGCFWRRM